MKRLFYAHLHFQEGKSDKIYEAEILHLPGPEGQRYLVNFRYGRRGSKLKEGSKTPVAVDFAQAAQIFKSVLVAKINKGYCLIEGTDPLSETLSLPPQSDLPAQALQRRAQRSEPEKILARLQLFAEAQKQAPINPKERIQGYSLSRTIWKAGEYRVKAAAALLPQFIGKTEAEHRDLLNWAIAWALGRIGAPESLSALAPLKAALPEEHHYLLHEVELRLSAPSEQLERIKALKQTSLNSETEHLALAQKIANDAPYATLKIHPPSKELYKYSKQALTCRELDLELMPQLKNVNLDQTWEEFFASLTNELQERLNNDAALFRPLTQAVERLRSQRLHKLKQAYLSHKDRDQNLYQQALEQLPLDQILSSDYERDRARQGQLNAIWGQAKKLLFEALNSLQQIPQMNEVLKRLDSYQHYDYIPSQEYPADELQAAWQTLAHFGFEAEVRQVLEKADLHSLAQWNFYQQNFSAELKSKISGDAKASLRWLFEQRRSELQSEKLKSCAQDQARFANAVLELYRSALIEPEKREQFLRLLQGLRLTAQTFALFRKLYKIAEFRQDFTVLARLNYRIETTPPLSIPRRWGPKDISKPFTRHTRNHFRRRMVRNLKQLAQSEPSRFTALAREVLLQVKDGETVNCSYPAFGSHLSLAYLLWQHSLHFRPNKAGLYWLAQTPAPNQLETERPQPEAHPELWAKAPQDVLRVLLGAQAEIVNDFALRLLSQQAAFCDAIATQDYLKLVQSPYRNTALFALSVLQQRSSEAGVIEALVSASHAEIRAAGLALISDPMLVQNLALVALLLCSPDSEVRLYMQARLYLVQDYAQSLAAAIVQELLLQSEQESEPENDTERLSMVTWVLLHPLQAQVSHDQIWALLQHPWLSYRQLALQLLQASPHSYAELTEFIHFLKTANTAEMQAGALSLLSKLPPKAQMEQKDLLIQQLSAPAAPLRTAARQVIQGLQDPDFQMEIFQTLVPNFFRRESQPGLGQEWLELVRSMSAIYARIDPDLLWRLLTARSKTAQAIGAEILPHAKANDFSLKQKILLSKNPNRSARIWALQQIQTDPQSAQAFSELLNLLDNPWEDSRQEAIAYLREHFGPTEWSLEHSIVVCDQVYADVQALGRELVTRYFEQQRGPEYLLYLSQHPSRNLQLFVSGFLQSYASGQSDTILALEAYFKTVLTQVNQGRLLKDRVLRFLFDEAQNSEPVAQLLLRLLSEHSLTAVVADKAQFIAALYDLQRRYPKLQNPLKPVPVRKVEV